MSRFHFLQPSEIRRHRRLWLLGANLIAIAILISVLGGGPEDDVAAAAGDPTFTPVDLSVPAPDRVPVEGAPALRAPVGSRAAPSGVPPGASSGVVSELGSGGDDAPRPRAKALAAAIEGEIARAVDRARKGSKGKVHGANTTVAVHVRDLEGEVLVARQATYALRPASNLKLVTCATALVLLGPDAQLETPFEAAGTIADGVLTGDLVARAGGDPLYRDEAEGGDGGLEAWIEPLARDLRAAGIERVTGALVLDEGSFLTPGPGPAWPDEREYWKEYCALAGGFSANAGCITATIRPGAVGAPASVRVRPREHGLERKGTVTTGPRRSSLSVAVEARARGLTVRGKIPADVPKYAPRFAAPDPVELFGHAVVGELARHGVVVAGGFRRERGAAGGEVVAHLRSAVDDTLAPILRDSNNSVADQLFLATAHRVGLPGSRAGGFEATRRALERLGVPTAGLAQVDGSGLSRDNRVSAEQLTALLAAMRREAGASADLFLDALPVAGKTGSLSGRMRSGPAAGRVRAKTGFIGGTSGLSGFVETASGETLVFSILVDYPVFSGLNTSAWKPMQDGICAALAAWEGDGR